MRFAIIKDTDGRCNIFLEKMASPSVYDLDRGDQVMMNGEISDEKFEQLAKLNESSEGYQASEIALSIAEDIVTTIINLKK